MLKAFNRRTALPSQRLFVVQRQLSGRFHHHSEEVQDANARYQGRISLRQVPEKGWGVFATKGFASGDLVMRSRPLEVLGQPNSHSVQISWKKHVMMDLPARFVNHICGLANVGVKLNDETGSYDFLAIRNIQSDEEILWDYETSEFEISHHFTCLCGSPSCRGILKGYRFSKTDVLKAYGEEFVAPYLTEQHGSSSGRIRTCH